MALFGKYESGSGVAKDGVSKKGMAKFWELYFRKAGKLVGLNFITLLFCIPIITIGPALTGMTKVLRNFVLEKNSFIFHDFKKGFFENFKKSFPIGIADILIAVSTYFAMNLYPQLAKETGSMFYTVLTVLSLSVAFTVFIMNFYIFPMIASTELSMKNILKNSFFLTSLCLKKNLIAFFFVILAGALTFGVILFDLFVGALFFFIWTVSFAGFIIMFNIYPQIQKYVINPFYEEKGEVNPEYAHLEVTPDATLFTDKGGSEAPVLKKGKGKVIS